MQIKVLHLVLRYKWYDMIAAGIKKEEYRRMTPYWIKRLVQNATIEGDTNVITFKPYTHVCFHRAYTSTTMLFELDGLGVGYGKPEWGAKDERTFILRLGKQEHCIWKYIK